MPNREFVNSKYGLYRAIISGSVFVRPEVILDPMDSDCDPMGIENEHPLDVLRRQDFDLILDWSNDNLQVTFEPINDVTDLSDAEKSCVPLGDCYDGSCEDIVSQSIVDATWSNLQSSLQEAKENIEAFRRKFPHLID